MQTLQYDVRFTTPAFLGNAEQSGQWRTPPFKALLRQWWRVVWAARNGFPVNVDEMRSKEGLLFGNAWLQNRFRKSEVRIRLSRWDIGRITSWNGLERQPVFHPEVARTRQQVGPHAYLGYGPLDGRRGTRFDPNKGNAAIQAGETATLSIAAPAAAIADIQAALALMDAYGAGGGRSRNGWGSLSLVPAPATNLDSCSRPWLDALALDWPHAIGGDNAGPLVWRTRMYDDWKTLMRDLAVVRIGLRTMFVFRTRLPPHPTPEERHWLSYPITNHAVRGWGNARLPNSLRFKVRPDEQDPRGLRGVVFHMPCLPPPQFHPDLSVIRRVWPQTHELLDELSQAPAGRHYGMLPHERRHQLRAQLDGVTLERIPG